MEDITIIFQNWSVDPEQALSPGQEVSVTIQCTADLGAQYAVLGIRLVDTLYGHYYHHESIVLNEVLGRSIYFSPGEVRTYRCRFIVPEHVAYSSKFGNTSLSLVAFANRRITDTDPTVVEKQRLTINNRKQQWSLSPTERFQQRPAAEFSGLIFSTFIAVALTINLPFNFNYGLLALTGVSWWSAFWTLNRLNNRPKFAPVSLEVRAEGTSAILVLLDFTKWPAIDGQVQLYYAAYEDIKNRVALQDDKLDYLARLTGKSPRVEFPLPAGKTQKGLFNLRDPEPVRGLNREGFTVQPHLVMDLTVDGISTLYHWPLEVTTVK